MYNATKLIESEFKRVGLKCQSVDLEEFSFVEAGFTGDNCTVKIRFISTDDDNDFKVLTEDFALFPAASREKGCVILNELNRKYKYMKFSMNDNGAVCAQYDVPVKVSTSDVGAVAVELAMRCNNIVDDAYPTIMKGIWG